MLSAKELITTGFSSLTDRLAQPRPRWAVSPSCVKEYALMIDSADGPLTRDNIASILRDSTRVAALNENFDRLFSFVDVNGDGTLSRGESLLLLHVLDIVVREGVSVLPPKPSAADVSAAEDALGRYDMRDRNGEAVLHQFVRDCISRCGDEPLAKLRSHLEAHCNPNVADGRGVRALHIAAEAGEVAVVEALLRAKADAQAIDEGGRSAADAAAGAAEQTSGVVEVLKILMMAGAKPKLENGVYVSVLHAHRLHVNRAAGTLWTTHHTCSSCGMSGPAPSFGSCQTYDCSAAFHLCMGCLPPERGALLKPIADAVSAKEVIDAMAAGATACSEVAAAGCRRLGQAFFKRPADRAAAVNARGPHAIVLAMNAHPHNLNVAKQATNALSTLCFADAAARRAVLDAVGGEIKLGMLLGSNYVSLASQNASRIIGDKAVGSAKKTATRIFGRFSKKEEGSPRNS